MSTQLELARWAHALHIDDAPAALRERLRLQAASILGAAAAGLGGDDIAPILVAARAMGSGSLRVAPGLRGLTLDGALFAGAALSASQEYDDWMLCGHTGHSAVWAAWLGAADLGLGWNEALRAQLAANEVLARLGGLCLAGSQGGKTLAFLHSVGGALVAGLLRGHSPEQLAAGMGLALSQARHLDQDLFKSGGRLLRSARPLVEGWHLADLVEAGMTGPLDLLDGDSDFLATFAAGSPARGWLTGLPSESPSDSAWLTWSLAIKCAPGGATLGTAVEALQQVLAEVAAERGEPLQPSEILRVDVDSGALTTAMERLLGSPGRNHPEAARLSVRRALAALILDGRFETAHLSAHWSGEHEAEIAQLSGRIRLHHDWRLTLDTWNGLRAVGLDGLLGEVGAGPLLAAAGRAGGLEAGLSLTELPLALASERLQGVQADELPALLGRGLSKLTDLAAKRFERMLPASLAPVRTSAPAASRYDLSAHPLSEVAIPLPSRVRVLLMGGHVHQAAVEIPRGAPGRELHETRSAVRAKLLDSLRQAAPDDMAAHKELVDGLLGAGNSTDPHRHRLPGPGPRTVLGA